MKSKEPHILLLEIPQMLLSENKQRNWNQRHSPRTYTYLGPLIMIL